MTHRRGFLRAPLGALVVVPLILGGTRSAASQTGTAVITGRVIVKQTDLPLGFAVVGIGRGVPEQFADGSGRFSVGDVAPGRVTLTVKHVGYTPFDTTFDVAAGETVRLTLEMSLVTIQLPAIHSLAMACVHPGTSTAIVGLELAQLLEQVRQNADRNRLLSRSYPFELTVERRISKPEPALEARFIQYDTVLVASERQWRYTPGKMIGTRDVDGGVFGGHWLTLMMPQLADFADDAFLNSHCWDYAGQDIVDGDTLLRIEFVPAPAIRDPDVSGAMFLDPKTYQLRQTLISLANLNKQLRELIEAQTVQASFTEVVPGVPVLDRVFSQVYPKVKRDEPPVEASTERQKTLGVKFLGRDPRRP